ncbi:hypothetical protein ACFGVS_25930 [Mucilaginibacter sp. AW1-7]|uniref:hypothetical protein n=1 Tax=Mucilaginibacter sp. AW1-7 TaxID=3349874 RepID=UPI003F738F41
MIIIAAQSAITEREGLLIEKKIALTYFGGGDDDIEGDWDDEDDEDFDDQLDAESDLREIQTGNDIDEPGPEDDDHLPDDDLQ